MKRPIILCVDDEKAVLDILEEQIDTALGDDFDVELADNGEEALELIEEFIEDGVDIALIISDQIMPGIKGDELLIELHKKIPETPKILLTGQASLIAVQNAINKARLYRYISKPWEMQDLLLTVEEATRSYLQEFQIKQTNRLNHQLRTFNRIAQDLSSEMNVEALVHKFFRNIHEHGDIERIVLLLEDERAQLQVKDFYLSNYQENQAQHDVWRADTQAFNKQILKELEEVSENFSYQTLQVKLPLMRKRKVMGYVYLDNAQSQNKIGEEKEEMLIMVVSQLAISLENANLYTAISKSNHKTKQSIQYAKRIQKAIMPDVDVFKSYFNQRAFVYYEPKDIVSGDFYWCTEVGDYLFVAVVDCTGHGVPGAFMSVLGGTQLNEIIFFQKMTDPAAILHELHKRLSQNLHNKQKHSVGIDDGMDLLLCRIEKKTQEVWYAGARRPLLLMRDGQIQEYKSDKLPIGYANTVHYGMERNFTSRQVDVQSGDRIYLFSDGVVDQFGGAEDKKLTKKRFKKFLSTDNKLNMAAQGNALANYMNEWKGNRHQTDDILVVGFEF